jgi:hypothetical protein
MEFSPKEVLFSLTDACNLRCRHCVIPRSRRTVSQASAEKFLKSCKDINIERVGFTGGEPFLRLELLCALTRSAVQNGMFFDKIMTSGVWYKNKKSLESAFGMLYSSGYDGDICISVDRFHRQSIKKVELFIRTVLSVWKRPDAVSIAVAANPGKDSRAEAKLKKLAGSLGGSLKFSGSGRLFIKGPGLFIKIFRIKLSPIGAAAKLRNAWNGPWFKDDLCRGPGNIFFVEPSGDVKPCCGYATGSSELTIGNIGRDSAQKVLRSARKNRFVAKVFAFGLGNIRKKLEKSGMKFPGESDDHCHFCRHILNAVPKRMLDKCLS